MLERRDSYEALYRDFRWNIPERYNIGVEVSDRQAALDPDRPALLDCRSEQIQALSFGELAARSSRMAHGLRALGVRPGDRVALLLPQGFETVIAH